MRSRASLYALLLVAGSLALPLAAHAAIPFFGPIIPQVANQAVCPAGFGMLMIVINNIISFLITIAIVFVAPLMIAYAGFLYVVNPVDPSGISKAKGILWNTIVGIVVALAGWMIVDAVMAVLYNPNARSGTTVLTTWSNLITTGGAPICLPQAGALPGDSLKQSAPGVRAGGALSPKATAQCASPACSPEALQAAGFNQTQANVMSCIAVTENSGNATGCNGNACGTFQIMLTANPLVGSACAQYNNGNPTLNCPALCKAARGGAVKNEPSCQPCVQAAQDPQCNAQAAQNMVAQSGYKDWTPPRSDNQKAAACVQQYANG